MSITHTGAQLSQNNMTSATEVFATYTKDKEITKLLLDFLSHLEENGKHISAATARTLTKDITTLSGGNRKIAVAIIEKALRRGWYSFYDLAHKEKEALHTPKDTGGTDRQGAYDMRLEIAKRVLKDALGEQAYMPSQKDWYQVGIACQYARSRADAELFERAYRHATDRLRIVGAGEA